MNRTVRVNVDVGWAPAILESLLSCLPDGSQPALEYFIEDTDPSRLQLRSSAGACFKAGDLLEAFHALETDIYDSVLCRETSIFILHASAVFHPASDRMVLLPGLSHSGKSTLAAALTASGRFQYVGEEAVGLDQRNIRVHSYTKPFKLRFGLETSVLRDNWYCLPVPSLDFTYAVPPPYSIAPEEHSGKPVLVIFPSYSGSARDSFERISPALAIGKLATYSINPPRFLESNLAKLTALGLERSSWALTWSSPEGAVEEIERLCLNQSRRT